MQSSFLRTCSDAELEEVIEKIKEMQSEASLWQSLYQSEAVIWQSEVAALKRKIDIWKREATTWKEEAVRMQREIDLLQETSSYYKKQMEHSRQLVVIGKQEIIRLKQELYQKGK